MKVLLAPHYDSNPYQDLLGDALTAEGVTVESAGWGYLFPLLRSYRTVGGVEVLHLHWLHRYFHAPSFPLFLVRASMLFVELSVLRLLGVRVVWTLHNLTSHEFPYPAWEIRLKRLFVHRFCDAVVAHCDAAVEAAVETYGLSERARRRLHVVPHGHYGTIHDADGDRERARERLGLPVDATVLLYFGIIRPYKNVRTLVRTFSAVAGPDSRLLVAGNPHTDELGAAVAAAARGDDRIHTRLEYVPDSDVRTYMLAADAVVLPFRDTLTSGSAVLAMSFGRAVVAPRLGCLPELLGSDADAVLYDPDDENGLAEAIRGVESLDLTAVGERNRRRVLENEWSSIAERTAALYRGG